MKNHQAPTGRRLSAGMNLEVHSIFDTIQGEGPFAGQPATFIRLAHCNLQCPACDTEYTEGAETLHIDAIADQAAHANLVVLTGGEPFRQNIAPLCQELWTRGVKVQIESNGMLPTQDPDRQTAAAQGLPHMERMLETGQVVLVISPKTHRLDDVLAPLASAYKYVITANDVASDGLPIRALGHPVPQNRTIARPPEGWTGPIFVQPADSYDEAENAANMEQAINSTLMDPARRRLCLQMHKYARLP